MRLPVRKNPNKQPVSKAVELPAPVKGWYAQENFVGQDPESAIILENYFPEPTSVRARRGHTAHATGMSGEVQTLMVYTSGTAQTMFAANGASIYDITSAGAIGAAAVTGLSNNKHQWLNMATSAGQFLFSVNGADLPNLYDGASWTNPAITGVDESTFINVSMHKHRLWFTVLNSMDLWYLPVDSIAGAAVKFPVGALFRRGGYVVATGNWSVDAGDGMDDMFVIQTSEGEIAVYQGTDPSSANTWALIGVFAIGDPIGRRCSQQVGGDLAILTEDGIVPISKALQMDRAAMQSEAITKNIRVAWSEATQRASSVFGWQLVIHPTKNMAVVNVPGSGSVETQQYVFNTLSGAWAKWTGMDAVCWVHFDQDLYFGGTEGSVFKADYGANDNGAAIEMRCLQAYDDLGAPGRLKHVKMAKPVFITDVDLIPAVSIAVDYEDPSVTGTSQDVVDDFFTWDVSNWDEDPWYGLTVASNWRGSSNIGSVIAPYWALDMDATGSGAEFKFSMISTQLIFEVGGVT